MMMRRTFVAGVESSPPEKVFTFFNNEQISLHVSINQEGNAYNVNAEGLRFALVTLVKP